MKNIIKLATITLGLILGGAFIAPAYATEDVMVINETTEETANEPVVMSEEEIETIEENGTSGETAVLCDETTDENCLDAEEEAIEEDEELAEPQAWPMILSICALIGALLVIIILNVSGRRA